MVNFSTAGAVKVYELLFYDGFVLEAVDVHLQDLIQPHMAHQVCIFYCRQGIEDGLVVRVRQGTPACIDEMLLWETRVIYTNELNGQIDRCHGGYNNCNLVDSCID